MRFEPSHRPAAIFAAIVVLCGTVPARAAESGAGDATPTNVTRRFGPDDAGSAPAAQLQLLENALEYYRGIERRGGWGRVPTDVVIGPNQSYDCRRIAILEKRLIAEGYLRRRSTPPPAALPPPGDNARPEQRAAPRREPPLGLAGPCAYNRELTDAVRAFQVDRKVLGAGQVGTQTMAQLNRPVGEIVDILERDVARWRNLSLRSSGTYLLVNIPFFELSVYEEGRETMRMPVIVGLPSWPTPVFSDELEYVIVNPDWGIPDRIAKLEYLPNARRDPNYLRRQGISSAGGSLRQKPGPRNPLGRIKFVMPNEHDVYLHDTPEKRAFTAAVKALSHGCIRLSNPMDLAHHLLRDDPQWGPRRLEAAIASGKTMQINLEHHMPVHVVYSTSRVNDQGRLELRPDVYKRNRVPVRAVDVDDAEVRGGESLDAWP